MSFSKGHHYNGPLETVTQWSRMKRLEIEWTQWAQKKPAGPIFQSPYFVFTAD